MTSRSMKKKTGRSTSSPARILCSSKQKHSTLAKYGAFRYVGRLVHSVPRCPRALRRVQQVQGRRSSAHEQCTTKIFRSMVWRPGSLLCRDMLVLVESLGLKDHTLGSIRDGVSSVVSSCTVPLGAKPSIGIFCPDNLHFSAHFASPSVPLWQDIAID
jgi:hypothetical protein